MKCMYHFWLTAVGVLIIFVATTLGSALVYFFKRELSPRANACILGFAGGVMIATAFFGLIMPALDWAKGWGKWSFVPLIVGLGLGTALLILLDLIPKDSKKHTQPGYGGLTKSKKFFLVVTLHNIPEGLAVGLAFGNAIVVGGMPAYFSALSLAIGIAVQNLPEGLAVSLAMKPDMGNNKAFLYGVLSGVVEPIFAILGIVLATQISALMPWFLAFAAGATIYVTVEELIPDSKFSAPNLGSLWFIVGFSLMTILEVLLG